MNRTKFVRLNQQLLNEIDEIKESIQGLAAQIKKFERKLEELPSDESDVDEFLELESDQTAEDRD